MAMKRYFPTAVYPC